jgi:uncharacterized protein (UPF0179 family)
MKLVKCISCKGKKQNQPLKIGKIYEVLETKNLGDWCDHRGGMLHHLVVDETGFEGWYKSAMFRELTTVELRDYKLSNIL